MSIRRSLLALSLVATPVLAQTPGSGPAAPVTPASRPLVSSKHAVFAGLMLTAAMVGDEGLEEEFQEHRSGTSNAVGRLGNALGNPLFVLPAIGVSYIAGRLAGNDGVSHAAVQVGKAVLVASGVTTGLKYAVGRARPTNGADSDVFRPFSGSTSFPSGHTTVAFAVATALADQTHDSWSDGLLYGAATLTAFARVNDDRHWTSDVLAGALIGHLSARWVNRRSGSVIVGPQAVGLSLSF